jgi:hypothetical protein
LGRIAVTTAVVCVVSLLVYYAILLLVGAPHASIDGVPLWLQRVDTGARIFQASATGLAFIIGGIFAYYRFIKERTHASRLQPTSSTDVASADGTIYLRVMASVQNIGQAKVELAHEYTGLRILTRTHGSEGWFLDHTATVFEEQDSLEPDETIGEPVWVEIPDNGKVALRLDLYVAESEDTGWLAREVVNLVKELDNTQGSSKTDTLTRLKEGIGQWWSRV